MLGEKNFLVDFYHFRDTEKETTDGEKNRSKKEDKLKQQIKELRLALNAANQDISKLKLNVE